MIGSMELAPFGMSFPSVWEMLFRLPDSHIEDKMALQGG